MLVLVLLSVWLGAMTLLLAVCRVAARGDDNAALRVEANPSLLGERIVLDATRSAAGASWRGSLDTAHRRRCGPSVRAGRPRHHARRITTCNTR